MYGIDSVKLDDTVPGAAVIVVQDINGAQIRYLAKHGILYPGRIWRGLAPGGEKVTLFLPFPDGMPEVLHVEPAQAA